MTRSSAAPAELDGFDIRLLDALQENNQRTSEELAELVHLSPTSCLRRQRRLRDAGIICADVSIISPGAFGPRMSAIVLVSLETAQLHVIDAFKSAMRATPQVTQCYHVAGAANFVLVVSARDVEDFSALTRERLHASRHVKNVETMVVMNRTKFDVAPRASAMAF